MKNWLKQLMLFRLLTVVIQFKKLTTTKKMQKLKEISHHDKYTTTKDFNKFLGIMSNERLHQAKLATNTDFDSVEQCTIKNEEKIENIQTFDLSCFLCKTFFGDNRFQNVLVYQPTFSTLVLKEENKGSEYVIPCKTKDHLKLNFIHYIMLYL